MVKYRLVWIMLWLAAACTVQGASFTAVVTAYNKANLTGDITENMTVTFENSYHSKGQVTKDNTAQLTVDGLPKMTVTGVTLWMHSNKSGGAGGLGLDIDGEECFVIEASAFKDWPGQTAYTNTSVPVVTNVHHTVQAGGEIYLHIEGTANSVYLDSMQVVYETEPSIPHWVALQWWTTDNRSCTDTLYEPEAEAGIRLPDLPKDTTHTWDFVGWTETLLPDMATEPDYRRPGSTFYTEEDITLYAVYARCVEHRETLQDTLCTIGEYVLAMCWQPEDSWWLASGDVSDGRLGTVSCTVLMDEDGLYRLSADRMPAERRYRLERSADSVAIVNIKSGLTLGYTSNKLSTRPSKWAVTPQMNGSFMFHHDKKSNADARVLQISLAGGVENKVLEDILCSTSVEWQYMVLFEVSGLPVKGQGTIWTGTPHWETALSQTTVRPDGVRKIMDKGQIVILRNGRTYDLTGRLR